MVLWGIFLRVVFGLHGTWLVNSATHMWGSRRFATRDDSRNSWWVALLTFGEGWHNNHHAHPVSARHGLAWYEFDISWITLKSFNAIGLVRDLKVAKMPRGCRRKKPRRHANADCSNAERVRRRTLDPSPFVQQFSIQHSASQHYPVRMISGRRRSVIFFTVLGICLVAIAVTLNISWIVLNWWRGRAGVLGVILFLLIIAGMVLNTIFLVREIRRNEQHDSFINAVTHELKTPVASIRLYLQTLQSRELDEEKRREFYRIMLEDSDRLLHTIEQVLRAGSSGSRWRRMSRTRARPGGLLAKECVELARTRFHLDDRRARLRATRGSRRVPSSSAIADELKAAVWNLIDNAIKYSAGECTCAWCSRSSTAIALAVR